MAPTGYSPRLELEKNGSHIFSEPCYSVVVHCTHTHRGSFDKPTVHDPFAAIITYAYVVTITKYLGCFTPICIICCSHEAYMKYKDEILKSENCSNVANVHKYYLDICSITSNA